MAVGAQVRGLEQDARELAGLRHQQGADGPCPAGFATLPAPAFAALSAPALATLSAPALAALPPPACAALPAPRGRRDEARVLCQLAAPLLDAGLEGTGGLGAAGHQ